MRNIKMLLAYDGTDFAGWQIQKAQRTVQGEIEDALQEIHGKRIKITAAGRTDSGVHATGQVVNFFEESGSIPAEKYCPALNSILPQDIRILQSSEVPADFNARRSAVLRVYRYYLYYTDFPLPHLRQHCLWRMKKPDIKKLNTLASAVVGEHDFTAFSAAGDKNRSRRRRVFSSGFFEKEPFTVYEIAANAFLWKMARSILGTILELEEKGGDGEDLKRILKAGDRTEAGQTISPRGLFLERVVYNHEEQWNE